MLCDRSQSPGHERAQVPHCACCAPQGRAGQQVAAGTVPVCGILQQHAPAFLPLRRSGARRGRHTLAPRTERRVRYQQPLREYVVRAAHRERPGLGLRTRGVCALRHGALYFCCDNGCVQHTPRPRAEAARQRRLPTRGDVCAILPTDDHLGRVQQQSHRRAVSAETTPEDWRHTLGVSETREDPHDVATLGVRGSSAAPTTHTRRRMRHSTHG
jgi:hypothetical protein